MTYAPDTLQADRRYLIANLGVPAADVGIVGDTAHAAKGTSYHLGKDQLKADAYSARTARDKAGLTDAASALDIGEFTKGRANLRHFTAWLFAQCRAGAPDTRDVREVIGTVDGKTVLRWDRERGVSSAPKAGEADDSHLWHTHLSRYRDAEDRPLTPLFERYLREIGMETDMDLTKENLAAIADAVWGKKFATFVPDASGARPLVTVSSVLFTAHANTDQLLKRPVGGDVDEAELARLLAAELVPHLPEGADADAIAATALARFGAALTAAAPEAGAAS